jgi:hypothetical protein
VTKPTRLLFALLLLCAAAPVRAAGHTIVGLKLDAGGPDGLGASVLLRPASFLRFEVGGTTDLAAPGVRAGIAISVPWYVSPALCVEAGHQWPGDLNKVVASISGSDPRLALLKRFSYSYANLHAGLELGNPNWLMLTFHAGYSYFVTRTSGLADYVAQQDPALRVAGEATIRAWVPSAKVGLLFYFH